MSTTNKLNETADRYEKRELNIPDVQAHELSSVIENVYTSTRVDEITGEMDREDWELVASEISRRMRSLDAHFNDENSIWERATWIENEDEDGAEDEAEIWRCRVETIDPWIMSVADVIADEVMDEERAREDLVETARRLVTISFRCSEHDRVAAGYIIGFAEIR
jgi:hypothetical protein